MKHLDIFSTVINHRGEIISCNQALRKMLGFTHSSQLIGKSFFNVFTAWEQEKLAQAINRCKANPELNLTVSMDYRSNTGQPLRYEWTISGELDANAQPVLHLLGRSRTKGPKETAGAADLHLLFEQFMNHSPIVGWVTDSKGIMHYMNPVYLRSYHFTKAQIGKSIFELFPPELAQEYAKNNHRVLQQNKPVETIETGVSDDGRQQVLKIFKFPLTVSGEQMVAGWAIDITDQIALQGELEKNLERFYYVKKATSDAIYDWDVLQNKIYRGIGFQTLFDHAHLTGSIRFSFRYIHPDDLERVKTLLFGALRNGNCDRWKLEYRFKDKEGQYHSVIDKAFIIRNEGRAIRVIGAIQDVSEQKSLQAKIIRQEKATQRKVVQSIINAQEKERRKLATELHDNVNQIISSCKLMLEVAQTNQELAHQLTAKASHNLQLAISEIRKISHALNPSELQDIGLVDAVKQLVENINTAGALQLHFTAEECLAMDYLKEEDCIAIYRIIQESTTNILKHAAARNGYIYLSLRNGLLKLVVEDDGKGFDKVNVSNGGGLRNIRNRVNYYEGEVKIRSRPGKGCRLEILMHVAAPSKQA